MRRLDDAIAQFEERYGSETACSELIEKLRWPNGYHCPSCNYGHAYRIQTRRMPLFECSKCGYQTSLTAGTVMHRSRTPLRKWLLTMYLVATLPSSINAVRLSEVLEVTYKTAWKMLHVIRLTISATDGCERLAGHIEAKHELYLKDIWMIESRMKRERSIIIAREIGTEQPARYKMQLLPKVRPAREPLTEQNAYDFVGQFCSEDVLSFAMNPRYQFSRRATILEQEKDNSRNKPYVLYAKPAVIAQRRQINEAIAARRQQVANGIVFASQLFSHTRGAESLSEAAFFAFSWMSATFRGIGPKYAQHYFDEYCFRLNHADRAPGKLFEKLVSLNISVKEYRPSKFHLSRGLEESA